MSRKPYYTLEELERYVEGNDRLTLKFIVQPKWTDFNNWVIEYIDFVLNDLNRGEYYGPVISKDEYLIKISEEINTLGAILLEDNKLPYGMTTTQIKERMNKLMDVFSVIYLNGGNGND